MVQAGRVARPIAPTQEEALGPSSQTHSAPVPSAAAGSAGVGRPCAWTRTGSVRRLHMRHTPLKRGRRPLPTRPQWTGPPPRPPPAQRYQHHLLGQARTVGPQRKQTQEPPGEARAGRAPPAVRPIQRRRVRGDHRNIATGCTIGPRTPPHDATARHGPQRHNEW